MDEFQNFATESFATILSEARIFRLNLTLATQYLAQMDEATAAAVFGNVGSLFVFQVGAADAEALADQLGGGVTPQDSALPRFTAYARLLIDGMPSRPFSIETLPPPAPRRAASRSAIIRRTSRHRYARAAAQVEREIHDALVCSNSSTEHLASAYPGSCPDISHGRYRIDSDRRRNDPLAGQARDPSVLRPCDRVLSRRLGGIGSVAWLIASQSLPPRPQTSPPLPSSSPPSS